MNRRLLTFGVVAAAWTCVLVWMPASNAAPQEAKPPSRTGPLHFQTSENCLACHNSLTTSAGEDVSIGSWWRASMMANSSRDPYWQASVRRETIDHPSAAKGIEDECSICHMPMSRTLSTSLGQPPEIFAHLPVGRWQSEMSRLAADGVSCTLCHQIGQEGLGTANSFTGGFRVATTEAGSVPSMFGPFEVDAGRTAIMRSAVGVRPVESRHVQQSELCATCHTLYTQALGPDGTAIGSVPEQVPYLEWRHSAFRSERSCQSCHMPAVAQPTPATSVLGEPREGVSRHSFLGGNFFMLRLLNRYRQELGVEALPFELEASARSTIAQLQVDTASVSIAGTRVERNTLTLDVDVRNLTGHKLPTGYPSRRTWLHVTVRDRAGRSIFESGAINASGAIQGNDNDNDASRYEPHYDEIRAADQVQIYESMMADRQERLTTGLLSATHFVKDNRLLPRGFNKATAEPDIAVRGDALSDSNFSADGDRVRYVVDAGSAAGPFQVEVELRYQPISFRWAQNLARYDAPEPKRFVSYYESASQDSSVVLSHSTARAE